MVSKNYLVCPADGIQLNETKVRTVAGLVLLTALAYGFTGAFLFPLLLTVDFGLRSFDKGRYSPLGNLAGWAVKTLKLPYKGADQAPKRFAARIGLGFGLLISVLHWLGIATFIPVLILAVFAALESGLGFCAGCFVHVLYSSVFQALLVAIMSHSVLYRLHSSHKRS